MNFHSPKLFMSALFLALGFAGSACALFAPEITENSVKVNTQAAFSECLKMCYDSDTRTRNSYSSCLDGCGRATADYPLKGEIYPDFERCEDGIAEVRTEGYQEHSPSLCADVPDPRKRQGCEEGVATFYRVIAAYSACLPLNENSGNLLAPPSQTNGNAAQPGDVHVQDLSD